MSAGLRGLRVVFLGRRQGALAAARRLGLEVVLLSERPPAGRLRSPVVAHHVWTPSEPQRAIDAGAAIASLGPRAVLALTEGAVAAAAELRARLALPGLTPAAAARCTDKLLMKAAVRDAGLPCADHVTAEEGLDRDSLAARLGLPIYLKPRVGSGGRGARRAERLDELPRSLAPGWVAEAAVEGEEMSVEALLSGGRHLFTNPTEYLLPGQANVLPKKLTDATRESVERLLDHALAALGVADGLVHMELFLTPRGPVFGELAARPPGGYLMRLIELAYGFDPWEAWLRAELGSAPGSLPVGASRWAGARLFHPGAGILGAVSGERETAALPGVVELEVRRRPGDAIPPRLGVSQEVAHLIVAADSRREVAGTLSRAGELLRLEVV